MIDGDRDQFDQKLSVLFAGIDKPLGDAAREAFWRGLAKMSLVEFNRCVDLLLRELEDHEGPPKRFSVADVWQAKHRLRAKAPGAPTVQPDLAWDGDRWDMAGNARLWKHITRKIMGSGVRISPDQVRQLVAAKNAWAADMRDIDDKGAEGVRRELQDRCWDDIIGRVTAAKAAA